MGKLSELYAAKMKTLSESEKYALCAIDARLGKCAGMNVTIMAEAIGVSPTTIIRLAKKLGYTGFSEFKYTVKNIAISAGNHTDGGESLRMAVEELLRPEHWVEYCAVADVIKRAARVYVFACGLSRAVGEYFAQLLAQSGINAIGAYDSHMIDLLAGTANHADVCVFISGSGNTVSLRGAAEQLNARNIVVVALTGDSRSSIAHAAQYTMTATLQKTKVNSYDATPRSALMLIADMIYAELIR